MSGLPMQRSGRRRHLVSLGCCAALAMLTAVAAVLGLSESLTSTRVRHAGPTTGSTRLASTPAPPSTVATTTTSTLPPPGPGFVAGRVTAIGDSVLIDYQGALQTAIPGVLVTASVGRQWGEGEQIIRFLKADDALGAEVIVALGTNGPITDADFDAMMASLSGASRVVFVNVHVDRPWQDPNNAVLARGVGRYPNAVLVDWASLAAQNPGWFGADGTHLAIDGPGADALAFLVAATLAKG